MRACISFRILFFFHDYNFSEVICSLACNWYWFFHGMVVDHYSVSLITWNRFLLHRLSKSFPDLPILALVDWWNPMDLLVISFLLVFVKPPSTFWKILRNPAGLAILCTYKFGSIGMGLEAYRYGTFYHFHSWNHPFLECCLILIHVISACNVKWLGLRGDDLQLIPEHAFIPMKPRDLQVAQSLMSSNMLQVC